MPAGSPNRWAWPAACCAVVVAVGGCSANPGVVSGTARPAAHGTTAPSGFAAFAGDWMAHTSGLSISPSGVGRETIGDGCCDPIIDLDFQLSAVTSSNQTHARAIATVTSVQVHSGWSGNGLGTPPRVGQRFTLSRDSGLLTDDLTKETFCDDAEEQKGTCGA